MRNPAPINHFPPTLFSPNRSPIYGEAHLFSQPARSPKSRVRSLRSKVGERGSASRKLEFELGANAFVLKRAIATDLWPAIEAVQAGRSFVSSGVDQHALHEGKSKPSPD